MGNFMVYSKERKRKTRENKKNHPVKTVQEVNIPVKPLQKVNIL